jgi:hypothetical protein
VLALYNAHLAAHVDPYLLKAQAALAPYHAVFEAKVYQPYVKPFLVSVLPAAVVPEPKKSYWSFVTDRLPGQKGNKTEKPKAEKPKPKAEKPKAKEQAKDVKPKAEKVEAQKPKEQPKVEKPKAEPKVEKPKAEAQQPKPEVVVEQPKVEIKAEKTTKEAPKEEPKVEAAKVAEPSTGTPVTAKVAEKVQSVTTKAATQSASTTAAEAETTASVAAATEPEPEAAKDHKADIVATLAELKRKLDFQAKASYGKLQSEVSHLCFWQWLCD